jgi:hypothetical protein
MDSTLYNLYSKEMSAAFSDIRRNAFFRKKNVETKENKPEQMLKKLPEAESRESMRFLFVKLVLPAYNALILKLFLAPPGGVYVVLSAMRRNI